jgi:hypothetical protein
VIQVQMCVDAVMVVAIHRIVEMVSACWGRAGGSSVLHAETNVVREGARKWSDGSALQGRKVHVRP